MPKPKHLVVVDNWKEARSYMVVFMTDSGRLGRRPMGRGDAAMIYKSDQTLNIEAGEVEAKIKENGWCGTWLGEQKVVIMPNGANIWRAPREYRPLAIKDDQS